MFYLNIYLKEILHQCACLSLLLWLMLPCVTGTLLVVVIK